MRRTSRFSGEQLALVRNPDPFAVPAWRSPVYRTPGWIITIVQLARGIAALVKFAIRRPVLVAAAVVGALLWHATGWPGPVALILTVAAVLAVWRWRSPHSFTRFITDPARSRWRAWHYRRHWAAVMTIGRLAPAVSGSRGAASAWQGAGNPVRGPGSRPARLRSVGG